MPRKTIKFPRRAPSVIKPEREIIFITADKTTCAECVCFPKESPYMKLAKIRQCLQSPLTLYELAAAVVDVLKLPKAFLWSPEDVADWMEHDVGFPQYRECITDNSINGLRLLLLADPSFLPRINIRYFEHIKKIQIHLRKLYSIDQVEFFRSIGLPTRRPGTYCTIFKSRTGPSWGVRKNWTNCDLLRWMKILDPAPVYRDHWDLVWYQKPDFPKTMFARIPPRKPSEPLPMYVGPLDTSSKEYQAPRKFHVRKPQKDESIPLIWMYAFPEHEKKVPKKKKKKYPKISITLMPKRPKLDGLRGEELILARRLQAKRKFFPNVITK